MIESTAVETDPLAAAILEWFAGHRDARAVVDSICKHLNADANVCDEGEILEIFEFASAMSSAAAHKFLNGAMAQLKMRQVDLKTFRQNDGDN